jgi:hypothetical protein
MNATDKKVMAKLIPFLGRKWGENSFLQLEDMHENASVLLWKTCSFFLKSLCIRLPLSFFPCFLIKILYFR